MSAASISPAIKVEPLWRSSYADPHLKFIFEFDIGVKHLLTQFYADVSACTDSAGSNPVVLGSLYLNPESECSISSDGRRQLEMLLTLSKSATERIEEQRAKARYHKVNLKVRGHMNVLYLNLSTSRRERTMVADFELTANSITGMYKFDKTVEIEASDWAERYLDALGLGKYLSIEIPMDLEEILSKSDLATEKALADRIANSAKLLTEAEKSLRKGDWEKAVGDVRLALEFLEKEKVTFQGEEISMTSAIKNLFKSNGFPPKVRDAVTMIVDNFYAFTSPAHHVQVKETEEELKVKTPFDKEDAQFAVGTLTLLLNILAKKLTKKAVTS